jgi:hypothetical protein
VQAQSTKTSRTVNRLKKQQEAKDAGEGPPPRLIDRVSLQQLQNRAAHVDKAKAKQVADCGVFPSSDFRATELILQQEFEEVIFFQRGNESEGDQRLSPGRLNSLVLQDAPT